MSARMAYLAPCPCGTPDAVWEVRVTAAGANDQASNRYRLLCGGCPDPPDTDPAAVETGTAVETAAVRRDHAGATLRTPPRTLSPAGITP